MSVQTKLDVKPKIPDSYRPPYDPKSSSALQVSRSKIDLFSECKRCAYLDLRFNIRRPSGPSFTLNNAVDELFKREFDVHRAKAKSHPLCDAYGVDAVPFAHEELENWRDALHHGITHHHLITNFLVRGGIDDVWVNPQGELIIVDYKATSKKKGPSTVDDLYDSYKRQMEVYQWLFRKNGFKVAPTGYFVYANGRSDAKAFDSKLEFDVVLIPYKGSDEWVESTLSDLKKVLDSETLPEVGKAFGGGPCEFCEYSKKRTELTLQAMQKKA